MEEDKIFRLPQYGEIFGTYPVPSASSSELRIDFNVDALSSDTRVIKSSHDEIFELIMSMPDLRNIAHLSRLSLSDKELIVYSFQLASILSYTKILNRVDTANTHPTSHPLTSLKNVFRKDILSKSLEVSDVLSNAPSKEDDFFKVPQVIDPSALRLSSGPMVSKVEPSAGLRVYPEQSRGIEGK